MIATVVYQYAKFSENFLNFFGDQIAFQARYFQSDHICDEIYIMPFIRV